MRLLAASSALVLAEPLAADDGPLRAARPASALSSGRTEALPSRATRRR